MSQVSIVSIIMFTRRIETYAKDDNAADDSSVLGRGKGVISRGESTLGGTAGAGLDVHALGRHCF